MYTHIHIYTYICVCMYIKNIKENEAMSLRVSKGYLREAGEKKGKGGNGVVIF